jgi:hypothetical protein
MLNNPWDMTEILIDKIQWPFLAQFPPALLLSVSSETKAEKSGG